MPAQCVAITNALCATGFTEQATAVVMGRAVVR